MANGSPLPEGFVLDEPQTTELPPGFVLDTPETPQVSPLATGGGEPGLFQKMQRAFTGEERMTPQMAELREIGDAPELNAMSVPAFKASIGLLTTGETEPLKAIFQQQFGEDVSFTEDEKGNTIVNLPSGAYALDKPGMSPQDVARTVFGALAFTPSGRAASIPGAIGRTAATEAAIEAAETGVGGEFNLEDVALAGALSGGAKGLERGLGAVGRTVMGRSASEIETAAKQAGIPTMAADVLEPKTFAGRMLQQTAEKIPVIGTGGRRVAQQQAREEAVDRFTQKYGDYSYRAIVNSLKAQRDKVKNAAGNVLERTGNKLDELGEIPLTRTTQAIDEVANELSKQGVIRSQSALDDLATLSGTLKEAPQTFSSLKQNRTLFNEIIKGIDRADRTQLSSRAKALLQKVSGAMKDDMDAIAKNNLTPAEYSKWVKANQSYAKEATNLTKTRLKNVLDSGDVTPESVKNLLFSRKPSEVNLLYKSLTGEGRQNARAAIVNKVIDDLSRRQAGITPTTFANEMKKYGLQTNQFFKGEEKRQLNGLLKALDATRRAQEAGVTTPTGQALFGAGAGFGMFADPASTLGAASSIAALARIYESAPVRKALLRLDSIPKGTTRFEQALGELNRVLIPAIQAARGQVEDTENQR